MIPLNFPLAIETCAFLNAIFNEGKGGAILDCINTIEDYRNEVKKVFRSYAQENYYKKASTQCGLTRIDVEYSTNTGPRILVRLYDQSGRQVALISGTDVVISAIPATVMEGIRDMSLNRIIDLVAVSKAGYGHEMLLDGNIAKAVKQLGSTALRRHGQKGLGQIEDVPAEHFAYLHSRK